MSWTIHSGCGDRPGPGVTMTEAGCHFAVASENATRIDLCLFDDAGAETRLTLPERDGFVWSGFVPGVVPGQAYGYRAYGPYAPDDGHLFNPAKLLLDPLATAVTGTVSPVAALGHGNAADSAPFTLKGLTPEPDRFDWGDDRPPATPFAKTVIYEAHVRGLSAQHPDIAEDLRGTYEALADPALLDHLTRLGVTAIELLPVHAMVDEAFLVRRRKRNYWGYNSIGFFAPEPRYFGPAGADGLKIAVKALHAAGIEVILDVVYNHTAEGGADGPSLSFRGLDNAAYYRLGADGRPVNDTGCGNTLRCDHPMALGLILDSLRHWVSVYRVDGFRFDLATTLGRNGEGGFDAGCALYKAILQDPVLSRVKLIAEPWDVGPDGYRLGQFPAGFAEWSDRFRDDVRRFWRHDQGAAPALAGRLLGSAEIFDQHGRRPWASVNLITAHDGFTLNDLVSYRKKRNEANGERNRDGHDENFSSNSGVEGPTDDPAILARRALRRRNLLATMMLAQGTPMLLAGDETGNSQQGNNNAYCQDNPVGWIDWANADTRLLAFVGRLIALRHAHPALRQNRFLHGARRADGAPDASWLGLEGTGLDWDDPGFRGFAVHLREAEGPMAGDDEVILAINGGDDPATLTLPPPPAGACWVRALATDAPDAAPETAPGALTLGRESLVLLTAAPEAG